MNFIGKYCLVCGQNSGIYVGEVAEHNGEKMLLKNARRIYCWSGAATVVQIAAEGVKNPGKTKFTMRVGEIGLFDVVSVMPCTEKAQKAIEELNEWKIK